MNFIKRLTVLFVVTYLMFKSIFMLLFFSHYYSFDQMVELAGLIYYDENLRIMGLALYGLILVFNYILYRTFSVNVRRGKVIAFDNPAGRVTVSLLTLQDLVKRIISQMDEVRESKVIIRASSKKNLMINIRITLLSDINIPGLTSRIQNLITKKIQDIIGIEEKIDVAINVGKILPQEYKMPERESEEKPQSESSELKSPPYHGYRA